MLIHRSMQGSRIENGHVALECDSRAVPNRIAASHVYAVGAGKIRYILAVAASQGVANPQHCLPPCCQRATRPSLPLPPPKTRLRFLPQP